MTERYTSQQRAETIKIYYRNSESVASTLRGVRPIYGRNNRRRSTIERLVKKFAPQSTQRMSQSIYCKPSLENVLSHEIIQSIGRLGCCDLTPLDYLLWGNVN